MNALRGNVRGKRVVLIDDSIVRGTTMRKIIKNVDKSWSTVRYLTLSAPRLSQICSSSLYAPISWE